MKKLISLLAALSVVSACSFGALATDFTFDYDTTVEGTDGTLTATDVTTPTAYTKGTDGLYTVDLTTVAGTQEQTTILAVEGTTISVGSIKYIDQSVTPSFSFDMDDPTSQVYVLAGGSAINPTYVGYIAPASTEPETFTISGTITGHKGTVTYPTVKVYNGETEVTGLEVSVIPGATSDDPHTFTVSNIPVLTEGSYTVKVAKTGYLSYSKANIAEATTTLAATIKAGDVDANAAINLQDLLALLDSYGSNVTTIEKDFDETATVNLQDLLILLGNYSSSEINE